MAECDIYTLANQAIIGSENGLSNIHHQAIFRTNTEPHCGQILVKFQPKEKHFLSEKLNLKCWLQNGDHFVLTERTLFVTEKSCLVKSKGE